MVRIAGMVRLTRHEVWGKEVMGTCLISFWIQYTWLVCSLIHHYWFLILIFFLFETLLHNYGPGLRLYELLFLIFVEQINFKNECLKHAERIQQRIVVHFSCHHLLLFLNDISYKFGFAWTRLADGAQLIHAQNWVRVFTFNVEWLGIRLVWSKHVHFILGF